jgi:hypothetical protein
VWLRQEAAGRQAGPPPPRVCPSANWHDARLPGVLSCQSLQSFLSNLKIAADGIIDIWGCLCLQVELLSSVMYCSSAGHTSQAMVVYGPSYADLCWAAPWRGLPLPDERAAAITCLRPPVVTRHRWGTHFQLCAGGLITQLGVTQATWESHSCGPRGPETHKPAHHINVPAIRKTIHNLYTSIFLSQLHPRSF